jgi:hypothetical protein
MFDLEMSMYCELSSSLHVHFPVLLFINSRILGMSYYSVTLYENCNIAEILFMAVRGYWHNKYQDFLYFYKGSVQNNSEKDFTFT